MSARHSSWLKAKMKETCATDNSKRQYNIWSSVTHHCFYMKLIHKTISAALHNSNSVSHTLWFADMRNVKWWCFVDSVTYKITDVSSELMFSQNNESIQKNLHDCTEAQIKHFISESTHETQDNEENS